MKMSVVVGGQSGADQSEDDGGTMPVTSSGADVGDDGAEDVASRGCWLAAAAFLAAGFQDACPRTCQIS